MGYDSLSTLYKFSSVEKNTNTSLSVLSYNVRLFNIYDWIETPNIENDIQQFVASENADVVAFQEYHPHKDFNLPSYQYKYESLSGGKT